MEEKIKFIDEYIDKLQVAIDSNDTTAAKRLHKEIQAIFNKEIGNIRIKNYDYSGSGLYGNITTDYIREAEILKGQLINYKLNLLSGLSSKNTQNGVTVTQQVTQQVQNDINLSFEQTISNVQNIPNSNLTDEEKDILCGKLASIKTSKDKESRWEKVQDTLKWIAEKGIEVGVAALPYIAKALETGGI